MLPSMPKARNHDRIPPMINAVADDVSPTAEWNHKLTIAGARRRSAPVGIIREGTGSLKQDIHSSFSECLIARYQEFSEPFEIGSRASQEDNLHGTGGGNSFGVPQLLTHSSTAATRMASPVFSYSA